MRTTRTIRTPCPFCHSPLDAAGPADLSDAKPTTGDLTICLYCGGILVFNAILGLRKPRPGEVERIYADQPELRRDIARAGRVRKQAMAERRH